MKRYLDSGQSARGKVAGSNRSAAAGAASAAATAASNSRLNNLLGTRKAKPAEGLDVGVIASLSVNDGGPAAKRSKISSRSGGEGESVAGRGRRADASNDAECLDVTASPPQRASATARSSIGGGGVSDGLGAGYSSRSSRSSSRGGSGNVGDASIGTNNRSLGIKRKNTATAGAGSAISSKMGPWMRRPAETAICAEEGYDPLELMDDANREIFGNEAFRGIQKDVRFSYLLTPISYR